jgi:hypothetical protein
MRRGKGLAKCRVASLTGNVLRQCILTRGVVHSVSRLKHLN